MHKIKQRLITPNQVIGASRMVEPTLPVIANGLLRPRMLPLLAADVLLAGVTISMAAADDFGSVKLLDLANKNLKVVGAMIDGVFSVAGLATNTGVSVDFALGSAATITTTFATAGEAERLYMNKIDGVGAAATGGTVKGHSFDNATATTLNVGNLDICLDAHATNNDFILNASSPVTSGTGVITFTAGFATLFYFDLGEPAA